MLLLMFFNMTYRSHCDVGTGFVTFAGGAQNLSVTFCHVALLGRRNSDVTWLKKPITLTMDAHEPIFPN